MYLKVLCFIFIITTSANCFAITTAVNNTTCSTSQNCITSSAYTRCEVYGFTPSGSAQSNNKALQNCINANANASITKSGTYNAQFGFTIPSNHTLFIGSGVTIKQQLSGSTTPFITNQNYTSSAIITDKGISLSGNVATLSLPSVNPSFKVGGYIEITQDINNIYNGIFKISTVSPTSISFIVNGISSGTSSNLRVAPADSNIIITGGGVIDLNSSGASGCFNGLNGMGLIFNRISNLLISNISIINACNYALETGNIFDSTFTNIYFNTFKDGLHNNGPFKNIVVDGVTGSTGDDAIVFLAADGPQYSSFNPTDACQPLNGAINGSGEDCSANFSGNLQVGLLSGLGLVIKNINLQTTNSRCLARIMPDAMFGGYSNISIYDSRISGNIGGEICIGPPVANSLPSLSGLMIDNVQNSGISIEAIIDSATIQNISTPGTSATTGIGSGDGTDGWINILGQAKDFYINNINLDFNQTVPNLGNQLISLQANIDNLYLNNININGIGNYNVAKIFKAVSGSVSNIFIQGGGTKGNSRVIDGANCSSFSIDYLNISNFVVSGNIGNADFSEYNCQITYNINNSTFSNTANGLAFNLWSTAVGKQTINITNSVITSGGYWYFSNGASHNATFNIQNLQSNANTIVSGSSNDVFTINAENITQTQNSFLSTFTGNPVLNVTATKISSTSFLNILNSNPIINFNNPDFTAPVDFKLIVKTNTGFSAAPSNLGLTMKSGSYPGPKTPFISNGINLIDILNPSVAY